MKIKSDNKKTGDVKTDSERPFNQKGGARVMQDGGTGEVNHLVYEEWPALTTGLTPSYVTSSRHTSCRVVSELGPGGH